MSLLQYVAQFVALLDVYRLFKTTIVSIQNIVIYIIWEYSKRLSSSDLVRSIVVCQTDAYPFGKLVSRTVETISRWFYDNRIADRPTSDTSAVRLSAIWFKTLISSIKHFVPIPYYPFNLGRIMQSALLINHAEMQNNS